MSTILEAPSTLRAASDARWQVEAFPSIIGSIGLARHWVQLLLHYTIILSNGHTMSKLTPGKTVMEASRKISGSSIECSNQARLSSTLFKVSFHIG